MKKLWAVLLCFVLLFAMTACGNSAPAASSGKQDAENEGIVLVLRDPDIGAGCREANHLSEIFDSCSNSDHDNTSSCVLCDGSFSGTFMPASRIIVSKLCSITCRVFCCFWRSCFSFLAEASSSSSSICCHCSLSADGSL